MLVSRLKFLSQSPFKDSKPNLTLAIAAGMMMLAAPVRALQVQVVPENPQLGDTISVMIQTNNPRSQPKVSLGQKSYPTFPLAQDSDRYRALLPTTPLDSPGKLNIRVIGEQKSSQTRSNYTFHCFSNGNRNDKIHGCLSTRSNFTYLVC
ncbi:MAG: hypothetical protein F6K10_30235, partial [Moorea sp. SIO2B7]|nr:hypothetical protein [Moorena sp. SIO2B7]